MKVAIDTIFALVFCLLESVEALSVHCSKYQNSLERIFSRRRRFIVFPTYASMKITVATGKSLISRYPRGVNLSMELSLYYALPTILEEWYPKEYRSSTTAKPKMQKKPLKSAMFAGNQMMTLPTSDLMEYYPFHSEGGTIWLEDGNWDLNATSFNGPGKPQQITHRVWKDNQKYFPSKYSSNKLHRFNHGSFKNWTRLEKFYPERWQPIKETKGSKWSKWPTYNRQSADDFSYPKANWKYFRAHRDRRDLFNHFEDIGSFFGLDIKSCILRSICESKQYLLPKGYSLIQDILRIMFSFPTIDGMMDDFSKAMNSNEKDCGIAFKDKCAYSFLDMAINPDKVI